MVKLNAARRLLLTASTWVGKFDDDMHDLPEPVRIAIEAVMNRLSADYPSVAHIGIQYGDPEIMESSDALATKSNAHVYLNRKYWTNLAKFDQIAKDWHECRVSNDFAGIIIHEVGHILNSQVLDKLGAKKYNALLATYLASEFQGESGGSFSSIPNWVSPSAYGQENTSEFTAEAFASFYLGRHAIENPNAMNLHAVSMCREMWLEFNQVLHGKPKKAKKV